MNAHICRLTLPIILLARVAPPCSAERPSRDNLKHEAFDTDPGWESFRSRLLPEKRPLVRQDFGYRKSNFAGGAHTGEIGGVIFRDHDRAYYAKPIPTKTLDDRLSMSGKFSVTEADGSSALMIGWFHHEKSQGWRTPNSVAMRFDGNGGKHWIFFEYGTKDWGTHGMGAFEGIRYQETPTPPYKADGTVHEFSLTYDPKGADGNGQYTFTCDGKKWEMPALEIHREHGATFDRFGIWNQQTPGSVMEFYIDDLVVDGVVHSLDDDPGWIRDHNPVEYRQRAIRPFHDVGYSETNYAGDQKGEIGGIMFRDREPAYYGDKIGPLTRDDELYASGKIVLRSAGADSGVYLGWFNGQIKQENNLPQYIKPQKDLLGVVIEGPSRLGHVFRAAYSNSEHKLKAPIFEGTARERPLLKADSVVHDWSIHYQPEVADGKGRITVTFDDHENYLDLKEGDRRQGMPFDRFGLFNLQTGGHHVEVYVDDLMYTSSRVATNE